MAWYGMVWCDVVWHCMAWHGSMLWHAIARYGTVRYATVCDVMERYGTNGHREMVQGDWWDVISDWCAAHLLRLVLSVSYSRIKKII